MLPPPIPSEAPEAAPVAAAPSPLATRVRYYAAVAAAAESEAPRSDVFDRLGAWQEVDDARRALPEAERVRAFDALDAADEQAPAAGGAR